MNTKTLSALVSATLLTACASAPANRSAPVAVSAPQSSVPAHLSRVYLYARRGQTAEQQDRDRFECFNWAAQQTGFDPSRYISASDEPEQFVPVQPAGGTILAGTVTGALVGAAVSDPWDRDEGAVIGAIAGTALGAVTASAEAKAIRTMQRQESPARASPEQQAVEHRRAMSACLEGRGYVVK